MDIAHTLNAIERKREEMIQAGILYGLLSIEVLRLSQELDDLLNFYQLSQVQESDSCMTS